jgi:hypothetical protein
MNKTRSFKILGGIRDRGTDTIAAFAATARNFLPATAPQAAVKFS